MQYPKRESHFAHKFVRVLHHSEAAQELGHSVCYLLVLIAHAEHANGYAGPVQFWNMQLMTSFGFTSPRRLVEARKAAVDAGWLVYERGSSQQVGRYFVTVPDLEQARMDVDVAPRLIYFIQCGEGGPIKIGITSKDINKRIKQLQIGSPEELTLLGAFPGQDKDEKQLHNQLAKHRIRGEWFEPHEDVRQAARSRGCEL